MDTLEAIKTRRSINNLTGQVPSKELITQILEAARWAPNHFNTQPWRFTVLIGDGRDKLGDAYGKVNQRNLKDPSREMLETVYQKGFSKAKRSPVVIVVSVEPSDNPRVKKVEEIAAVSAAVQNMLLAAHALGLGAKWRTGDPAYTDIMKENFGVSEKGLVIGLIFLGYPEEGSVPEPPVRKSVEEFTTWVTE
ncbi:nitroreductase [Sporolactobacillus sp. THM7-4]|nr:nitroreductase [Sporolactobacillus sp. THM7-4]